MAKQIPCDPMITAVLTPTTWPRKSTSGPPEFPGFSAASVWMMFSISRPVCARRVRPSALTTPVVTVAWNPSGFPMAITSWPTRSPAGHAHADHGRPDGLDRLDDGLGVRIQRLHLRVYLGENALIGVDHNLTSAVLSQLTPPGPPGIPRPQDARWTALGTSNSVE